MQRMPYRYFGDPSSMRMSRRRQIFASMIVALIATAVIGSVAEFSGNVFFRALIRPFALLGFVFGNVHQGSYAITLATLFVTIFALTFVLLRAVLR